jgi:hypothetical protein
VCRLRKQFAVAEEDEASVARGGMRGSGMGDNRVQGWLHPGVPDVQGTGDGFHSLEGLDYQLAGAI